MNNNDQMDRITKLKGQDIWVYGVGQALQKLGVPVKKGVMKDVVKNEGVDLTAFFSDHVPWDHDSKMKILESMAEADDVRPLIRQQFELHKLGGGTVMQFELGFLFAWRLLCRS